MQSGEGAQQPLPHVGAHSGRRLASADQARVIEIDRDKLGKGAAEIDEQSEGRHCDQEDRGRRSEVRAEFFI